ncbi:MAG: tyrosine-type recombinase/integrase [Streptosporangiaceae bacterium]
MKLPEPYRACFCRDPRTGRLLGQSCPDLEHRGHGAWYARYEAPRDASTRRRRQPRIGPYPTKKACTEALLEALGRVSQGAHVDNRRTTFGEYLTRRLRWWESEAELKPSTLASYREAVELYFRPGLGHVRLADLRDHHFRDLYAAMRLINRTGQDADNGDLLRRLLRARSERDGKRVSSRPLSEARIKRLHAVALSALSDAVPQTLAHNPAATVKLGGKRGGRKVRPLLWTEPRVERWQQTGEIPAPVMVWTAAQCGAFLDSLEGSEDPPRRAERLYALFHVAAYFGLRRSELAGLAWAEVDLGNRRLHVRQAQTDDVLDSTKSEDSDRQLVIDEGTAGVLRAWRKAQLAERLAWGSAWTDSGRVFTREDGTPLRPGWISVRFGTLASRAGLPPIRFHDLRHGAASMLLAAGVEPKVISRMLGHATVAFTMDVYTQVAEELAEAAASAIAAYVPRRRTANQLLLKDPEEH